MIPVVYLRRDFSYTYKSLLKKNDNVIENFFCQPAGITIMKVKKSFRVVDADPFHYEMVRLILTGKRGYNVTLVYLRQLAKVQAKDIRLASSTNTYVNNSIQNLIDAFDKVLGVHI